MEDWACGPHQDSLGAEKLNKVLHWEEGDTVVICAKMNSFVPLTHIKTFIEVDEYSHYLKQKQDCTYYKLYKKHNVDLNWVSQEDVILETAIFPVQLLKTFLELKHV